MFAWICPKCGKEIPPQYDGCPEWCPEYDKQKAYLKGEDDKKEAAQRTASAPQLTVVQDTPVPVAAGEVAASEKAEEPISKVTAQAITEPGTELPPTRPGAWEATPAVPPTQEAAPQQPAPQQPAAQQPAAQQPPPATSPPPAAEAPAPQPEAAAPADDRPWRQPEEEKVERQLNPVVVMVIAALGFLGVGAGAFYLYNNFKAENGGGNAAAMEAPARTGPHRLNKFVSVNSVRFVEVNKSPQARFVIVNYGAAAVDGLGGEVAIRANDDAADAVPIATFTFSDVTLDGFQSRELTVPLETNKRAYELPDWQFFRSDLTVTEPAQ
jgi:hypothetical protein